MATVMPMRARTTVLNCILADEWCIKMTFVVGYEGKMTLSKSVMVPDHGGEQKACCGKERSQPVELGFCKLVLGRKERM